MRFLECPHCGRQAVRIWEIIIFPSPFWLSKTCRYCQEIVSFNYDILIKIIGCMIIGVVVGNVIIRLFSINSIWFEAVLVFGFTCIPIIRGNKLFAHNKKYYDKKFKS
jgi:prepilin signal peptidase PulO-like enzyme (type II secretory pathway)